MNKLIEQLLVEMEISPSMKDIARSNLATCSEKELKQKIQDAKKRKEKAKAFLARVV